MRTTRHTLIRTGMTLLAIVIAVGSAAAQPDTTDGDSVGERRHVLSVATNMLYNGFYMPRYGWAPMPNVEVEYYPRPFSHWTYMAAFTAPYWHRRSQHKYFQIRDYHIEARRYAETSGRHTGVFWGMYANADKYGIGLSDKKGWQGEGIGLALKGGWVWQMCRSGRWRVELSAAAGGYVTRFDPYVYGNPVSGTDDGEYYYDYSGPAGAFARRNHQRVWVGPTELNLKLRYDLLYRRIQRKGVSTNRREVAR